MDEIQNANLVISHTGVGTVVEAIQSGTPIIVIPRQAKYEEHLNDHQVEFAKTLEHNKGVHVVYNVEDLAAVISHVDCDNKNLRFDDTNRTRLINTLNAFVQNRGQ